MKFPVIAHASSDDIVFVSHLPSRRPLMRINSLKMPLFEVMNPANIDFTPGDFLEIESSDKELQLKLFFYFFFPLAVCVILLTAMGTTLTSVLIALASGAFAFILGKFCVKKFASKPTILRLLAEDDVTLRPVSSNCCGDDQDGSCCQNLPTS